MRTCIKCLEADKLSGTAIHSNTLCRAHVDSELLEAWASATEEDKRRAWESFETSAR